MTTQAALQDSPRVLLGVSGGIAAYKSAELCRRLLDRGLQVQVVMTRAATEFVGPLTFQALSGRPVRTALLDPAAEAAMGHIELARWADLMLIAPASADLMARLAAGMADDLLSTTALATPAPLVLAPAMNQQMWQAPATRRNLATLLDDGVRIWGPAEGDQACGDIGPGRMLEPQDLADRACALLRPDSAVDPGLLGGRHVVITAGPTREAIDPVRFLSNHSSGKQGFALAAAARAAGARVTLVAGPVALATPAGVERIDVTSAREMHAAAQAACKDADVFIGVAAVADFRVDRIADQKIKKGAADAGLELRLVANPDIIGSIAAGADAPLCVAFAAETEQVALHARSKLTRKGVDLVVANDVSDTSIGFGSDDNAVLLVSGDGDEALPKMSKAALASTLMARIAQRLRQHENGREDAAIRSAGDAGAT